MSRRPQRDLALLNWVGIERDSSVPLYKQITAQIRSGILSGRLSPSACLPASRALAQDLGVSRVRTLQAYDQLIAEGFLETIAGPARASRPHWRAIRSNGWWPRESGWAGMSRIPTRVRRG